MLVAQPAVRETLAQPSHEPFAQRLAVRAAIAPLSVEESADYIRHQVRAAGGEPGKVFADDAIPMLAEACRGVPRLLNRAAAMALEVTATGEAEQADVEAVLEALDRLGLAAAELDQPNDPVLLPHPARAVEPARSRRGKSTAGPGADEGGAVRGSKDKSSRKRSA
jgi:hypothetical protein